MSDKKKVDLKALKASKQIKEKAIATNQIINKTDGKNADTGKSKR